jgi:hypothetical protein
MAVPGGCTTINRHQHSKFDKSLPVHLIIGNFIYHTKHKSGTCKRIGILSALL